MIRCYVSSSLLEICTLELTRHIAKGLLTILREDGNLDTFMPGSKERHLLKRYWMLYPDARRNRDPVASEDGSQSSPVENRDSTLEHRQSPNEAGTESLLDAPWDLGPWHNSQPFDIDGAHSEEMTTSFDIYPPLSGDKMNQTFLGAIPDAPYLTSIGCFEDMFEES